MSKFIKSPTLSTSFSESGKSAKKRFENILNTKAKKTGIVTFVIFLVIIGIVGATVAYDNLSGNNDYLLSNSKLTELAQMPIGADMATLDFASEDRVILHYGYALIVYDLKQDSIFRAVDLSKLNVPINTQGDTVIAVQATADGSNVIISSQGMPSGHEAYAYNIAKNTIKKIKYAEKYPLFTGLSDMDFTKVTGWSSHHCVWLSETKQCYLLLSNGFYVSSIKIIVEEVGNTTEYIVFEDMYAKAAVSAQAILDTICASTSTEAEATELIAAHQTEFDNLVNLDKSVLPYLFTEFENNDSQSILRENIMMLVCRGILGDEDIEYTAERGLHWYNTMKDYIVDFVNIEGENAVRSKYPKASMILDYSEYDYTVKTYYKQVMEYMAAEDIKAFSPYYDVIDQIASNYKENISGDNFEATFFYKQIMKNYYKNPDTVDYIKKARESGNKNYQQMYDEYNLAQEANYDFRVTAKILADASLDMSTFKLYTNISPKGTEWQEIKDLSVFIGGSGNE